GYLAPHLDDAIAEGRVWRVHAMRRTLWVVGDHEVGTLDAAVGASIAEKERKRFAGWLPDDVDLAGVEDAVVEVVRENPGIATRELSTLVPVLARRITMGTGKWAAEAALGSRLLMILAFDLRLARGAPAGSWKSSQYGWYVPRDVERPGPRQARAALVRRYVERFGPVTETDVKWYTGLSVRQTREALGDAGAIEVAIEGGTAWDAPDAPEPAATSGGSLLPGLDPTPMGYKERSWFLGEHEGRLFDRNGNIGPTLWVDGRIVGGWAVTSDARVVLHPLEAVGSGAMDALRAEAAVVEGWLQGVSVTPRFRTPLEKELTD
ncbi:MAG: AlkZ family DNA glycosylase, partial [Myxococcales bacterium]|nr:AlkZ family DNA glycosylase [Myxococcales bacterium]